MCMCVVLNLTPDHVCITTSINQIMINKFDAFEMWIWRRYLKISYTAHNTNIEVLQQVSIL